MNPRTHYPITPPARSLLARIPLPRLLAASTAVVAVALGTAGGALAQAASPTGGIGEQLNLLSGEAIDSGGTAANMGMYLCALITFLFGVWSIWKSRQPQNREGGHMAMGVAGLVLCGLFAAGPSWINKAAVSTSGKAASVTNTATVVKFQ